MDSLGTLPCRQRSLGVIIEFGVDCTKWKSNIRKSVVLLSFLYILKSLYALIII